MRLKIIIFNNHTIKSITVVKQCKNETFHADNDVRKLARSNNLYKYTIFREVRKGKNKNKAKSSPSVNYFVAVVCQQKKKKKHWKTKIKDLPFKQ